MPLARSKLSCWSPLARGSSGVGGFSAMGAGGAVVHAASGAAADDRAKGEETCFLVQAKGLKSSF